MQELRTAKIAADHVQALGYEVTRGVGGTGVVAVLRNGAGPIVMLRADDVNLAPVHDPLSYFCQPLPVFL